MCKYALCVIVHLMSEPGHREREKAKRRRAIEIAALDLYAERGFEETTIQEIADRASVSPRTVLMYFTSKADIALSSVNLEVAKLTERLKKESKKASVMEIYATWFKQFEIETDSELRNSRSRAFKRNPTLTGSMSFEIQEAIEASSVALAKEYGLPKNHIGILLTLSLIGGLTNILEQTSENQSELMNGMRTALEYADAGLKAVKSL